MNMFNGLDFVSSLMTSPLILESLILRGAAAGLDYSASKMEYSPKTAICHPQSALEIYGTPINYVPKIQVAYIFLYGKFLCR